MKIKHFKYKKEEEKEYKILLLDSNDKYISGINLLYLTEEEQTQVQKIQTDYEALLKPFTQKAYRKFLVENITEEFDTNGTV